MSNAELLSKGMSCLIDQIGMVEAERFISIVIREKFDYTEWQRAYFDRKTPEEISREAAEWEQCHPYTGKGEMI